MKIKLYKTTFFIVVTLFSVTFFSCESNFKEVQKSNFSEFTPSGEADSINLKYTDSGRIKAVLKSPRMLDYAAVSFPFTEFPNGINVTLFDEKGKKTFVTSKYAVTYKLTDIIDLQGNVKITNETGQLLFYTEKKYKFTDPKGVSFGEGIDFSKDFKIINSQKISGQVFENP